MNEEERYGASPRKANRKSCLNCAYLTLKRHPYWLDTGDYEWFGEKADCFQERWKRQYSPELSDALSDFVIRAESPEGGTHTLPLAIPALYEILDDEYGLTLVPTRDDDFLELATYKCRRFYPKSKLNQRELAACWEDQKLDKAENDKNWTRGIAVFALIISALSLWRTWV